MTVHLDLESAIFILQVTIVQDRCNRVSGLKLGLDLVSDLALDQYYILVLSLTACVKKHPAVFQG